MLEALPPEDVKALVVALTRYSIALANDEPPPNFSSVASPMAQAMCQIMAAKIDRDSEKYRDTAEKRSRKATKADLSQPQSPKADTSQVTKSKSKPKPKSEAVAESEAGAESTASSETPAAADRNPSGDCGGLLQEAERRARSRYDNVSELDIQRELRDLQHAEQLARTYGLPQFSAVYSSMLDDVEKHGWEKLEGAIKEAAAANSRSGLSVNFYRAVLQNGAKPTNRGIPRSHLKDL